MTYPVIPPGVVVPPTTALEQKVNELERKVNELTRRDLSNVVVGQGGTFRATLTAGGVDVISIKPGSPTYGSKQQMTLRDQAGNAMYRTDELAGYGLSAPIYTYFMAPIQIPANLTAGVEGDVVRSDATPYNPGWYSMVLFRNFVGITSLDVRFQATDGNLTVTSSTQTIGGPTFVAKAILLPASFMDGQNVTARWYAKANITGTVECMPITSLGAARARYDIMPH